MKLLDDVGLEKIKGGIYPIQLAIVIGISVSTLLVLLKIYHNLKTNSFNYNEYKFHWENLY